jgi:hypothetical protein
MPAPALPPNVATGELITSAWGNAVVDSLRFVTVNFGGASQGQAPMVSGSTILLQQPPTVPYGTRMFVAVNVWGGADGGQMDGLAFTVETVGAGSYTVPGLTPSLGNRFGHQSAGVQYNVNANASPQFSVRVAWVTAVGTTFVAGDAIWWQYRQIA